MNVEVRQIKSIGLAKYNPRKISDQALDSLVQSIERFGFVTPVIVNDRTGILVGGHQRIKAAKKLGLKDVPVVAVNLDESEEKALNVALNKISGEWDLDLLRGVLEDVQAAGLDLSLTGFSDEEWRELDQSVEALAEMPELATGDRAPIQQMTFTLHDEQAAIIKQAMDAAKNMGPFVDTGNENSNGNALSRVAELFLSWGCDHGLR
jgi:ParB-like chromosome segregation protein Spo0J